MQEFKQSVIGNFLIGNHLPGHKREDGKPYWARPVEFGVPPEAKGQEEKKGNNREYDTK